MYLILLEFVNALAIRFEYRVVDFELVGEALLVAALEHLKEVLYGLDDRLALQLDACLLHLNLLEYLEA